MMTPVSRTQVWRFLNQDSPLSRIFDAGMITLIILNVVSVIAESVTSFRIQFNHALGIFEYVSVLIFTAEYLARVWSCPEDPRYNNPVKGRIRFFFTFTSVIDLLSILPFYFAPGLDLRHIRILRMIRVFRILKLTKYHRSMATIGRVFNEKKEELVFTFFCVLILLVISSCLMYNCENNAQPEVFSSIPASMWWSMATLTTIGYGDAYPVTLAGKTLSCVIAFLGIGVFALPTGIIGSGLIEEFNKSKKKRTCVCKHCGGEMDL